MKETHKFNQKSSNTVHVYIIAYSVPEAANTGHLRLDNTLTEWDTTFLAPVGVDV